MPITRGNTQSTFDGIMNDYLRAGEQQLFLDNWQRSQIETQGYFNGPLYGPGVPHRGGC